MLKRSRARGQAPTLLVALALVLGLGIPAIARAEIFQLVDNTRINGDLVHFYDGVLTIKTAGGELLKLPREKVKGITFKLPPSRPAYSTPEKTFDLWRGAILKGNFPQVIECYALMYQGMLAQQMGEKNEEFSKLQNEVKSTRFTVKGSEKKGDTAVLKISRKKGDDVETAALNFVLENGEWKMRP
jgi:hypothetical protein